MSDIITGLRTYLMTKTAVTNLVSGRIYPNYLPQKPNVMPSVVLREISGEPEDHLTGGGGLRHTRIQVDCYGETHLTCEPLREAIRVSVKPSTKATWGTQAVVDLAHENFYARQEPPNDGSDNWRLVYSFDIYCSHNVTEPS